MSDLTCKDRVKEIGMRTTVDLNKIVTVVQTMSDPFSFPELDTLESNIAITEERIQKGAVRVWLREDRLEIYREHDKTGITRYFAVDKKASPKVTLYCVRLDYAATGIKPLRAGCQAGVWKAGDSLLLPGLAQDIFWKILFRSHDMISDAIQTKYGRQFWID
jgi:hypothetical protein